MLTRPHAHRRRTTLHDIILGMLGCVVSVGCSDDASSGTADGTESGTSGTAGTTMAVTATTPGSTGGASADGDTTVDATTGTDDGTTTTDGTTDDDGTASTVGGSTTDGSTTGGSTTDGSTTDGSTGDGSTGDGSSSGGNNEPPCGSTIPTVYRDFQPLHVDFGCHMYGNGARPGLVLEQLGADLDPELNPAPPPPPIGWSGSNPQITSAASFAEWYDTVEDVNLEIAGEIELTETAPGSGVWSFSDDTFYPLTDQGLGNNVTPNWAGETYPTWNGAFTTEIHVLFEYELGQEFTYIGDDDVWVYVDGLLALDLGGLHGPVEGTIYLDDLGLTPGQNYTLDVFHAERCGSGSHFRIDTSIACIVPM